MQVLTFDEILTKMCDDYDELISPKKMSRSNTNIVYLILKAVSKGFELVNNICVVLSNKFDPANCSEEDLVSVAYLVGTEKFAGSATGLTITVSNPTASPVTLLAGTYTYALDDDTHFIFEVISDTVIASGSSVEYLAMSENIGKYPVTAQASIEVTADVLVSGDLKFSCGNNSALLGTNAETNLEFRQRILTDTSRQDTITELENKLKALPYLYDAKVVFNNSLEAKAIGSRTLPSFTMAIFFSGSPRTEIAEVVAGNSIYPTLTDPSAIVLQYVNDVFVDGYYNVNIIPFDRLNYDLTVNYMVDTSYISSSQAQAEIRTFLENNFRGHVHQDLLREEDIYTKLKEFNVAGITILNIDISYNGDDVPYIIVPASSIAYLSNIAFEEA